MADFIVKQGGVVKSLTDLVVKTSGTVKSVQEGWVKQGGVVKQFWPSGELLPIPPNISVFDTCLQSAPGSFIQALLRFNTFEDGYYDRIGTNSGYAVYDSKWHKDAPLEPPSYPDSGYTYVYRWREISYVDGIGGVSKNPPQAENLWGPCGGTFTYELVDFDTTGGAAITVWSFYMDIALNDGSDENYTGEILKTITVSLQLEIVDG